MLDNMPPALVGLTSAAGAIILKEWIPGAFRWFTGESDRQKSRTNEALAERDHAEEERDAEARAKRRLEIHCTELTRYLVEAGWQANDPRLNWPKY